ncbi:MAG: JAB domain-containing protein [Lysobacteraceae bacterium]
MNDFIRDCSNHYSLNDQAKDEEHILKQAERILARRLQRQGSMKSPAEARDFLRLRLAGLEHEEFHAIFLDQRHRIIACESLARGTIDGASVHTREVAKRALFHNAVALVFAHNHPSGNLEPSEADRFLTLRLIEALRLLEIRVLDHFVVSPAGATSFAERGLL